MLDSPMSGGGMLILGASGLLGRALLDAATGEVVGTHHRRALPGTVGCDLRDRAALEALLDRVRPATIVNCAYVQDGPDAQVLTAEMPGWLAEASGDARLVHVSSGVVFPGRPEPVDETSECGPVHAYGRAKLESERRVLEARPDALIVRTSILWGRTDGVQERLAR